MKFGLIYYDGKVYLQRTEGPILGHWNRELCKQGEEEEIIKVLRSSKND